MRMYFRIGGMVCALLAVTACNQSSVPTHSNDDGESRYAEKQSREAYINSPAFINVQLGIGYMREGRLNLALSKLKRALSQSPQLAIAHSTIAILYERLGEYGLAENHHTRAVSLDPNDSRLRNNYGQFLCSHRDARKAIEQFDIAAGNPLYQTPFLPKANAGMCAMRINDLDLAETYLRAALQLNPKLSPALSSMVVLSVKQKRYEQGRLYLQRYLEVGKHDAETLWAGYVIEKNLGNGEAADNYAVRLKSRYPDSNQTKQLLNELNSR